MGGLSDDVVLPFSHIGVECYVFDWRRWPEFPDEVDGIKSVSFARSHVVFLSAVII